MSKFLYPRDLYRSLSKVWDASPFGKGALPVRLPKQKILNHLLDVCYHASFLVEESRPITFRIVFIEKTTCLKPFGANNLYTELYMFDPPLPFTAAELRRLAPATDFTRVLIAIQCTDEISGGLGIVGLIDIGSSLWASYRYERHGYHELPDALIVTVTRPGQLTIWRGSRPIIRLLDGGFAVSAGNILSRGPVHDFFREASGRSAARATLGGEFPACTLSVVPRVPNSPMVHVSASPPLIPDGRMSRVRLAASDVWVLSPIFAN
jgi:hypothetical protein